MPIDTKNKIIFVHIPRTGGTTIEHILGMNQAENLFSQEPLSYIVPNNKLPQHLTYMEICDNLPQNFVKEAFSFSFVRNPWSRILSEFLWRKTVMRSSGIKHMENFTEFVRFLKIRNENKLPSTYLDAHLDTQCSYLFDKGNRINLSFIGRFEGFEDCAREIFGYYDINMNAIPRLDRDAAGGIFVSKTPSVNYRKYYNDETKGIIDSIYKVDIDTLKYTF